MRADLALLVAAATALIALAPASAATLKGNVKVESASCVGVKLIPRTAKSEREVAAMFGSLRPSVVNLPVDPRVAVVPGSGRDTRCSGWSQGFRFGNVAPGDYFLTVAARHRGAHAGADMVFGQFASGRPPATPRDTYIMRPVRVDDVKATITVNFRHD
jgi:hypothetical protein